MSIKKAWRSWSVASKIILIFLCALVPVNVLLIYSTQSYMAALRFQMINSGRNVMELAMLRLDNQMDTMELYLYTQSTEDSDFIRVSMDEGDDFFLVSLHSVYRDFSNNLAVNSISGFYYLMAEESQQITHLKIESYERELEKSKILMRNIQLQVRPHFMLNLFHLIYSMAQIQNYKGIQEMTLYLPKYFRKLFSKGDVHTLAEECELVSGYFKVLYTQYPDCFGFTQELDESVKEVKIPTGTAEDGAVIEEKTASYILGHLSDKLSVEDLAFRAHLNPDYLNRVFKKAKGISINKFIINQRMSLAMELMKGGLSATAAAQEVGYQNYANFVNMFKKVYGKLPSQLGEK